MEWPLLFGSDTAPAEAKAFVRAILRAPVDRLPRLAFSDWLEERGGDSNTAWANYVRAQAELETVYASQDQTHLLNQCDRLAHSLRATLELPFAIVAANFETLPRLLPPRNIRVRLDSADVPVSVIEMVPESVARENEVFPLALSAGKLAMAAVQPCDDFRGKLAFILNREVTLFSCETDDLLQAIDRNYGSSEVESIVSVLPSYDPPWIEIASDELIGLFQTCIESGYSGFTARRSLFRASIEYFGPRKAETVSISKAVYKELFNDLLSLRRNSVAAHDQVIQRLVQISLRNGLERTIWFEREVRGRWFQVTFLDE